MLTILTMHYLSKLSPTYLPRHHCLESLSSLSTSFLGPLILKCPQSFLLLVLSFYFSTHQEAHDSLQTGVVSTKLCTNTAMGKGRLIVTTLPHFSRAVRYLSFNWNASTLNMDDGLKLCQNLCRVNKAWMVSLGLFFSYSTAPKAIYKVCFISNENSHLLRVYSVPDTLVSGLHVLTHLVFITTLSTKCYYYPAL